MGAFRVLVTGPKHFTNYPTLRATLDKLLARRPPDVELLTCDGAGVATLTAIAVDKLIAEAQPFVVSSA